LSHATSNGKIVLSPPFLPWRMIELTVRARDTEELLMYFDLLKVLIAEGRTRGTLMDGWEVAGGARVCPS